MTGKSPVEDVEGNRYKMLAIAVTKNSGLTLGDALSLTLVEAYLSLGANFRGGK
jgi:hypothetical protein|tara:strand:+ start:2543 stop:2704 length:162 start_codon:yes stop_codon:yes gene_type:complete